MSKSLLEEVDKLSSEDKDILRQKVMDNSSLARMTGKPYNKELAIQALERLDSKGGKKMGRKTIAKYTPIQKAVITALDESGMDSTGLPEVLGITLGYINTVRSAFFGVDKNPPRKPSLNLKEQVSKLEQRFTMPVVISSVSIKTIRQAARLLTQSARTQLEVVEKLLDLLDEEEE